MAVWEDTCPFSFASRLLAHEATPNGAFGAKVMYPCLEAFLSDLKRHAQVSVESEAQLMNQAFPGIRWIFIERRDRIRQAISFVKSTSTGIWHSVDGVQMRSGGVRYPKRNFGVTDIERALHQINGLNESWDDFFSRNDLFPFRVHYEDLADDYASTVRKIIDFIGLENSQSITIRPARTEKLSDAATEMWVKKFQHARRWNPICRFASRTEQWLRNTFRNVSKQLTAAPVEPHVQRIRESLRIIEDFESILRFNPGSIVARTVLGMNHERLNQLDQARSQYRKVLSQNPEFLPAVNRMAHLSSKPD